MGRVERFHAPRGSGRDVVAAWVPICCADLGILPDRPADLSFTFHIYPRRQRGPIQSLP
jgi:hypothetical protein